ncbi:dipeptidase [Paenibacillus xerothermodurans]|uniref:Membrane dipeptidase n=1 Tax=Paenibacillus xerothermodurans TaxID=1977292 RepID=A0A2W1P5I3_PAEXE|nr:dipeptidase [Paenibacillus xerothermodurans]PZE22378.1 membrane dipeptidase [Paenibacillus xerothermodurans]
MNIIDGHCDALWRMYENPAIDFYNPQQTLLDVNYARLVQSGVKLQCFAIYLSELITQPQFEHYMEYINIFYRKLVKPGKLAVVRNQSDLVNVMNGRTIGGILCLEGGDAIQGNPLYTETLFHLGVRMIGITWNYANWAGDGILEPRQGGLSLRGKSFVTQCNQLGMILDVSHLSTRSFWDVAAISTKPFVATHSNTAAICRHPRNLSDDQIRVLIEKDGRIGATFVPWFVSDKGAGSIAQLIKHIDHICALGGEQHVVLGSDFDGVDKHIPGLEHAGQFGNLVHELGKYYKDETVANITHGNWYRFLLDNLPLD